MTGTKYEIFPEERAGFLYSLKFKLLILIWYSVQNTGHILLMSYTRSRNVSAVYHPSVAVFFTELVKVVICLLIILKDASFNPLRFLGNLKKQILLQPRDTLKVCIPTMLYVFQNNIQYVGASHLNATAFMITLQLKLVSAAIFSVILLKRRLNAFHWSALFILFAGVCIVQLNGAKHKHHTSAVGNQVPLLGFIATVVSAATSGFAGVFLEKILKDASPVSLWTRNVQMAIFSIPCCIGTIAIKDGFKVMDNGLLHGFDWIVWGQVFWLSIGGLTVGACIKYADNITKDMATSMAIILATIGSMFLFAFMPSWLFALGAAMVISGIFFYSYSSKLMKRLIKAIELRKIEKSAQECNTKKNRNLKVFQLKLGKKGLKPNDSVVPIDTTTNNTGAVVAAGAIEVFVVGHKEAEDKISIIPQGQQFSEVDLEKLEASSMEQLKQELAPPTQSPSKTTLTTLNEEADDELDSIKSDDQESSSSIEIEVEDEGEDSQRTRL